MNTEKTRLINRLRYLYAIHEGKSSLWRLENNISEEVGCITQESCIIASLLPEIQRLKITINDIHSPELTLGVVRPLEELQDIIA